MKYLKIIWVINRFCNYFHYFLNIDLLIELRANQDQNKLEEFKELRLSIINRIEEIEEFFDDNFYNEFIFYFERGKYILKKLLMYEPNLLDEIDNGKNI